VAGTGEGRRRVLLEPHQRNDAWGHFREILRSSVPPAVWQTWLDRLAPVPSPGSLVLVAPSEFHLRWVLDKHGDTIEAAFRSAYGPDTTLSFSADGRTLLGEPEHVAVPPPDYPAPVAGKEPGPGPAPDGPDVVALPSPRIPKYRFESFVVGPSNRFAWAASMAVAEHPGSQYNPLFIYGTAGLGKTHLLNAIGHHARELYSGLTSRYVTSETFFAEFIDSIRRKRMDEFKARYRTTDILLLDDVQFFEGKEQILEEFFHTFNSLYEAGKQMVISSDRHPRYLSTLEDRLRSRFEWGLITDIEPPDIETRIAILKRNAELGPLPIPSDVLEFIATLVSDNIRELEGSLTRVSAFASLTGQHVTVSLAEKVLQDLLPGHEARTVDPQEILYATASSYGFGVDDLRGPSRKQPLVLCRQIAMYLCRDLTDLSLPKIGDLFQRDHTTVLHAVDRVKAVMATDREVFDRVNGLSQSLRKR